MLGVHYGENDNDGIMSNERADMTPRTTGVPVYDFYSQSVRDNGWTEDQFEIVFDGLSSNQKSTALHVTLCGKFYCLEYLKTYVKPYFDTIPSPINFKLGKTPRDVE